MAISVREARSLIRKARRRVPEGEAITSLNLTRGRGPSDSRNA
jgi:hypothetical protein